MATESVRAKGRITATLSIGLVLSASWSCAPSPEPEEDTTEKTSAIWGPVMLFQPSGATGSQSEWDLLYADMTELWDDAKVVANYYSQVAGAISAVETIARLLGILAPAQDPSVKVIQAVNAVAQGLSWQISDTSLEQNYADLLASIQTIDSLTRSGMPYGFTSPGYQDSLNAVNEVEQPFQYQHVSVPQGNDGGTLSFPAIPHLPNTINWKSVISARPAVDGMGLVYDWRRALPLLMKMISMRLFVIGTVDPNFRNDHWFDTELTAHREALKSHYDKLSNGIQCASKDFQYAATKFTPIYGCNVVCADIYTGISAITSFTPDTPPAGQSYKSQRCSTVLSTQPTNYANAFNSTAWAVRSKLPLFQLRSMIDQLYMFLHPAWDLTQRRQRISSEPAQTQCVEVQGGSAATGTPLQLGPCNGTPAQQWTYDRSTGQLRNGLGTCMDQRWRVNLKTVPGTWLCDVPQGSPPRISNAAQMWSYDPETRTLMNGLGTTLMATAFTQGAPLWNGEPLPLTPLDAQSMGFYLPSTAPMPHQAGDRAWRDDQVLPSSSCGTLQAGEGLNTGSTLYSCDGRFGLVMGPTGNLLLWDLTSTTLMWTQSFSGLNGGSYAHMQADGNFVVYPGPGITAAWATGTVGYYGSRLLVQNDGNVVVYDASNVPRWATNTCCH